MKKALMIAYHYPPYKGSTGAERTFKFSRYLSATGWQPVILTARPRTYDNIDTGLLSKIPKNIVVRRAFAMDAAKDLSVRGKYLSWTAIPDRWASWFLSALPFGLLLIRKHRPDVIWSTFPVATAHCIGYALNAVTKVPWVAEFRDPMAEEDYPVDFSVRRRYLWIEERIIRACSRAVFTTSSTLKMYKDRYRGIPPSRYALISNGYDESDFSFFEHQKTINLSGRLVLLHSGTIYRRERDPRQFFTALSELVKEKKISPEDIVIVLRGSGHEDYYSGLIRQLGIESFVRIEPLISHQQAVAEMMNAGALLLLQASNCNSQIPAKVYEYLRAGKPILALTDPEGDTATLLRNLGINTIASLSDKEYIKKSFLNFIRSVRQATAPISKRNDILQYSRENQACELAEIFKEVI
jgi:glycosyltransferase involved in cell wall biosynthesis